MLIGYILKTASPFTHTITLQFITKSQFFLNIPMTWTLKRKSGTSKTSVGNDPFGPSIFDN